MSEMADRLGWDIPVDEPAPEEGSPEEAAEEPAEEAVTAPEGRPRNEKGQFVPAETGAPETDAPEQPAETSILDKYGGDVDKALKALEESQSYIGDLHRTQGELTRQLAELTQAIQSPKPQQDFEALLESNPQQAAEMALAANDQQAYQRAVEEWNDLAPGAPQIWAQNLYLQQQMAELRQQVEATQAPLREQQQTQTLARAYQEVEQANPDFAQLQPVMSTVVGELGAAGYDWITPALESGDPVKAKAALTTLVEVARARTAGNLADQATEAARQHVAETQRAKADAIVASASTTVTDDGQPQTPADRIWEAWQRQGVSIEDGWLKPG